MFNEKNFDKIPKTMISFLDEMNQSDLDIWFNMSEKANGQFLKDFAKYTDHHPQLVYSYIRDKFPDEYSVHFIVYQSLSTYSINHFSFLEQEINRVIDLAYSLELSEDVLEILLDRINILNIYQNDYSTYQSIVDSIISTIDKRPPKDILEPLLDFLYRAICVIDKNRHRSDLNVWKQKLYFATRNHSRSIKNQAKEVFGENQDGIPLKIIKAIFTIIIFYLSVKCLQSLWILLPNTTLPSKQIVLPALGIGFLMTILTYYMHSIIRNTLLRFIFSMVVYSILSLWGIVMLYPLLKVFL